MRARLSNLRSAAGTVVRPALAVSSLAVAVLAACTAQPSKLDPIMHGSGSANATDPWTVGNGSAASDSGGTLGGVDLKTMLSKVAETIEKPGPYEAPEHSVDYAVDKAHWDVLEVGGKFIERTAFSWRGGSGTELHALTERLRGLAKDDKVTGVLLRVASLEISLPDAVELRVAMHALRAAGKTLACHTEDASNASYLVLSACERIGLAPLGQVAITGPAAMPIHLKGLLDRLGITADFLHVGAYKGAAEPLTREAPSDEMKETLGAILDRRYQTMVDVISADRKLDAAAVKTLIDRGLFPSPQAKDAKLVDDIASFETFRDAVGATTWTKIEMSLEGKDQFVAMMKIARFLGAIPVEKPAGPHVAVVYALGDIVDGGGDGVLGARQQIASRTLVAALRAIAADDTVKAVVLRIDSGGGSAQASELIWQAVEQLEAKKPVIVSMSDVAASGGYYIASGATQIFALPDTLTGSIGVVGGKIAPGGALAKLGVTTFPMGRGKRATMMASLGPWNAEEKEVIQKSMEDVYEVFTARVASGRAGKVKDVKAIAQGRVWTGEKAKELGLVDTLGGLGDALAAAQAAGKVLPSMALEIYPPSPTLRDVIGSFGGVQTPSGVEMGLDAVAAIEPELADQTRHLVKLALSFHDTAIQAVAILPVVK